MTVYFLDVASGVEILLSNTGKVAPMFTRESVETSSMFNFKPIVIPSYPLPTQYIIEILETANFESQKRKLQYLHSITGNVLCVLPSLQEAFLGVLKSSSLSDDPERLNVLPASLQFSAIGLVAGHMREAEDATLGIGATTASDANASNGKAVQLNAQNEDVYFDITQSAWELPLGDYTMYIRAKDSNQIANDCRLTVRNLTDAADVAMITKTLPASYVWYTLDFTIASGQSGDEIRFKVIKDTATANTISVDMIAVALRS